MYSLYISSFSGSHSGSRTLGAFFLRPSRGDSLELSVSFSLGDRSECPIVMLWVSKPNGEIIIWCSSPEESTVAGAGMRPWQGSHNGVRDGGSAGRQMAPPRPPPAR